MVRSRRRAPLPLKTKKLVIGAAVVIVGLLLLIPVVTMALVFSIGTAVVKTDVDATVLDRESQAPVPGCLLVFDLDRYADSRTSRARTDATGRGRYDAGDYQYVGSILLPHRRERKPDLRFYLGEKPRYGTFDEVEDWDVRLRFDEPWFAKEAAATVGVQRSLAHEDMATPPPGKSYRQAGFAPVATEPAERLARAAVRFEKTAEGRAAYRITLTVLLDKSQIAACQATTPGDLEKRAAELYNAGNYAEALAAYREAIRTGKERAWAYRGVADCLSHLDRRKEAPPAYRKAVGVAPDDLDTLYWYANSLIGEDDKEAGAQFQKLIGREPGNARGSIGFGNTLYNRERFPEAIRAFDQAIRLCATCLSDDDRSVYADCKRLTGR